MKRGFRSALIIMLLFVMAFVVAGCQSKEEKEKEAKLKEQEEELKELSISWTEIYGEVEEEYSSLQSAVDVADLLVTTGDDGYGNSMTEEQKSWAEENGFMKTFSEEIEKAKSILSENKVKDEEPKEIAEYDAEIEKLTASKQALEAAHQALLSAREKIESGWKEVKEQRNTFQPTTEKSIAGKDSTGVQIKATVKLSSWMKGDDVERLNAVWKSAGGEEDFPVTDDLLESEMKNAVVLIGQISYENITPDFSPESFRGVLRPFIDSKVEVSDTSVFGPKRGNSMWVTRTSNGVKSELKNRYSEKTLELPSPKMVSANWGPVPFALIYSNYLTANYPDGDLSLDYIQFEFYLSPFESNKNSESVTFSVKKEWANSENQSNTAIAQ